MKKSLLWALLVLLTPCMLQASELTVYNGTSTNANVPFYGNFADFGTRCQFIIPANNLGEMAGGTINNLTFYAAQATSTYNQGVTVYMTEVDNTTFASATFFDWDAMTPVYVGNISVANNELALQLSTPYHYSGRTQKATNCAEFDKNTYTIYINDIKQQEDGLRWELNGGTHNYKQAGTYSYDRAGWGPGKPCNVQHWLIRGIPAEGEKLTLNLDLDEYISPCTQPNDAYVACYYVMADAFFYQ